MEPTQLPLFFFTFPVGDGDMAVSHTVGSNVFDILLCLGIPWLVKTTVWDYDSAVVINSHGLFVSCFFILGSIAVTLFIIYYYKWVLDKKVGCIYLIFYFIFMGISIYVEMKAFGKYNPPMCIVDVWISRPIYIWKAIKIGHCYISIDMVFVVQLDCMYLKNTLVEGFKHEMQLSSMAFNRPCILEYQTVRKKTDREQLTSIIVCQNNLNQSCFCTSFAFKRDRTPRRLVFLLSFATKIYKEPCWWYHLKTFQFQKDG